jgi:hypothetical protein
MAEAEPGRGVHQRQRQHGHSEGPDQGLHEVCTRMTRPRTEKQAGGQLGSGTFSH